MRDTSGRILDFMSVVLMSVILLLLYSHHRLRVENKELKAQLIELQSKVK